MFNPNHELLPHVLCMCLLWALRVSALAPTCRSIKILSISDSYPYVSSLVCAFFMFFTPLWIIISSKHPASRTLLYSGWEPVITAMVISRCACVLLFLLFSGKNSSRLSSATAVWNAWWLIPWTHCSTQAFAPPGPLEPCSPVIHPSQRDWLACLLPQSYTSVTTLNENTFTPFFKV